jgi:glycosyltransferase involved in cell wall biosynthesis/peptidoglycan/xylan/chitin deacetylase (PgdA/CDA1 family)
LADEHDRVSPRSRRTPALISGGNLQYQVAMFRNMKVSDPTRVLMLVENNTYPRDMRVQSEASTLTQAGYHVTVIAPAAPGEPWHAVVDGVVVYRYPAPPALNGVLGFIWEYGYSLAASFMLSIVVFLRRGFNVIHAANPPDLFVLVAAFYKLFGVRFVFDHHDLSPEMYCARFGARSNRFVYEVLLGFEKLSCRVADHVIANNHSYMALEVERDRVAPERITVVRNGPNLSTVRQVEPDPGLRRKGKTIIGYVGVTGFQDGVDYLLRALKHLVCDLGRTDFFCVLIGDGDAGPSLRMAATELGLGEYVWFTGLLPASECLPYLSAADLCVEPAPSNPYTDHSTTIKIMEYMALAKPIVAFDLPEHRFSAREAACYVQPSDELAFARALAQLMDDPERRHRMGAFGRERVESVLAWPHSVPSLLKAYRTVLSEPGAELTSPPRGSTSLGSRFQRWMCWLRDRSVAYLVRRSIALVKSYGVTPPKAKRRLLACVTQLASHGCHPTFPIPGWMVHKYGEFSRGLQTMGAELAIHGYDHVDLRCLPPEQAGQQLVDAAAAFQEWGIQADGFRCPYLSTTKELPHAIPRGLVQYSSNKAIWWDVVPDGSTGNAIFDTLRRFYRAESSQAAVATPRMSNGLVEIPVSLPDDLQLLDGLNLDQAGIRSAWAEMLHQIHRRGELFVVLFHPESYDRCAEAFENLLSTAERMRPGVWVAQLRDVNRWWREKAASDVDVSRSHLGGLRIRFNCSERATVLVRHLDTADAEPWCDSYRVLKGRTLDVPGDVRPFIGVAPDVPDHVASFLEEQGYILEYGHAAGDCGVYLDAERASRLETEVQLVDHIESSTVPLVRFSRWPNEFRSALCMTGDIDALSLVDYAARLFSTQPRFVPALAPAGRNLSYQKGPAEFQNRLSPGKLLAAPVHRAREHDDFAARSSSE